MIFLLSIVAVVKVKSLDYLLLPLNTESFSETGKKKQNRKKVGHKQASLDLFQSNVVHRSATVSPNVSIRWNMLVT